MKNANITNPINPTNVDVIIIKDDKAPTGYSLKWDNTIVPIDKVYPDNGNPTLALPENPSNRRFWKVSKILKGDVYLSYKESRPTGPRDITADWERHMTPEERATYEQLKKQVCDRIIAERAAKAEKKEMSELEKAQEMLKKARERVAKLKAALEGNK